MHQGTVIESAALLTVKLTKSKAMKTFKLTTAALFLFICIFEAKSQVSVNVSIGAPVPVVYEPVVYVAAPRVYVPRPVYVSRPAEVIYVKEKKHHKHGRGHHKKHGCGHKHHR